VDFFIILGVSALSYHLLEMPFLRLKESRHNKLISLRVADLMDYAQSSGGGAD
jgi:peptidoglycan/LPS O-acetylase OafA/YrhL